ncbi:ABC-2 transporter permease [Peptoniphilus sp. KCTC 25270]|uniref:ABC-2 transporter permease n=1 Tax=Peptoniphilus sp. KCTC 25270 TaxID=2897414 RepID=UPI001E44AC2A|nr:ABC-2 transporter permease [Peptoniphilus sp. KCTC 25270]MCD1147483.1 ABC-2 transporter permease [Peptoniphilus sp. KCTC 25270]
MCNILLKEIKLSASPLAFLFVLFGFMFLLPGYPILCGVFFSTLGIFKSFEFAREANDTLFSALLPIAKKDVVKGRFCFICMIEISTTLLMLLSVIIRMTAAEGVELYRNNVLMNANLFALGAAFIIFGLFNLLFVGGFFKTGYKVGRPFVVYMIAAFLSIGVFEALHHIPGLEKLNAFGADNIELQIITLISGVTAWSLMTALSCNKSCAHFETIDL